MQPQVHQRRDFVLLAAHNLQLRDGSRQLPAQTGHACNACNQQFNEERARSELVGMACSVQAYPTLGEPFPFCLGLSLRHALIQAPAPLKHAGTLRRT